MKRFLYAQGSKIISIGFLIIFSVYVVLNREDFNSLFDMNPLVYISLVLLVSVSIVLNGIAMKLLTRPFKLNLSVKDSIKVSTVSTVGNFFAPAGGGIGVRALYLKKKHKLNYRDYVSVLVVNYIYVFLISSLVGVIALFIISNGSAQSSALYVFFFSLLVISGGLLVSPSVVNSAVLKRIIKNTKITESLSLLTKGLSISNKDSGLKQNIIAVTILNLAVSFSVTFLILYSLNFTVSGRAVLLMTVLSSLSLFINITPANLGIKESVLLFSSSVVGLDTSQVLSFAIIERTVQFLAMTILWLYLFKLSSTGSKLLN